MTQTRQTRQVKMYLDEEQYAVWLAVKSSFGVGYSDSGILYKLVQERNFQIADGTTKRELAMRSLALIENIDRRQEALITALAARGINV